MKPFLSCRGPSTAPSTFFSLSPPIPYYSTLASIRLPSLGKRIPIDHVISLEIRIPLDAVALIVQPGQHLAQEISLLLITSIGLELRQPDRTTIGNLLRLGDVFFEMVDAVVGRDAVPVDGEEIDMAATAAVEEGFEIREPQVFFGTVADRGGAELEVAVVFLVEGFDVLHPAVDALTDVHIGLGGEIRFVESKDVLCTRGDGVFDVGSPVGGMVDLRCVPEHGDEFFNAGDLASRGGVPVVKPSGSG